MLLNFKETGNIQQTPYKLDQELQRFLALQSRYCIEELTDKVTTFFFFLSPPLSQVSHSSQINPTAAGVEAPLLSPATQVHPSILPCTYSDPPVVQINLLKSFIFAAYSAKWTKLPKRSHTHQSCNPKSCENEKARRVNWHCHCRNTGIIKLAAPLNETSS